jgi:hypothetical protein
MNSKEQAKPCSKCGGSGRLFGPGYNSEDPNTYKICYECEGKESIDPQEFLKKYLEMLEGSLMMSITAFRNIQKSKNLSAAQSIAHKAEESIVTYAKTISKS